MSQPFDRIEFESDVKECIDARVLDSLGDGLSTLRRKGIITKLEHDECNELLNARLRELASIKRQLS